MPQNCYKYIDLKDLISTVSMLWPSRRIPYIFSESLLSSEFPVSLKNLIRDAFQDVGKACDFHFFETDGLAPLTPGIELTLKNPVDNGTHAAALKTAWGRSINYVHIIIFKLPLWYDSTIKQIELSEITKNSATDKDIVSFMSLLPDNYDFDTAIQLLHDNYDLNTHTANKIIDFLVNEENYLYIESLKKSVSETIKHEILHAIGLNHPHEQEFFFKKLQLTPCGTNCTIMDYNHFWPSKPNCSHIPNTNSGLGPLDIDLCRNLSFNKIKNNPYPYFENKPVILLHAILLMFSGMINGFIVGFTANININNHQLVSNNTAYILGSISSAAFLFYMDIPASVAITIVAFALTTHLYPSLSKINIILPLFCLLSFTYYQHWNGLFNNAMEIAIEVVKFFSLMLFNLGTTKISHTLGKMTSSTLSKSINFLFFQKPPTKENTEQNKMPTGLSH